MNRENQQNQTTEEEYLKCIRCKGRMKLVHYSTGKFFWADTYTLFKCPRCEQMMKRKEEWFIKDRKRRKDGIKKTTRKETPLPKV